MDGNDASQWRAWYRPGRGAPWRLIGAATSEAAAWESAFAYPLPGDKTVTSPGRHPAGGNGPRRREGRRT
jgi:hypothetical protein